MRKLKDFPLKCSKFNVEYILNKEENKTLKEGLVPCSMDDKWLVDFRESWLYFYRSWTGCCIYKIKIISDLDVQIITEVYINHDEIEYRYSDDISELELFFELLNLFLNKKLGGAVSDDHILKADISNQ